MGAGGSNPLTPTISSSRQSVGWTPRRHGSPGALSDCIHPTRPQRPPVTAFARTDGPWNTGASPIRRGCGEVAAVRAASRAFAHSHATLVARSDGASGRGLERHLMRPTSRVRNRCGREPFATARALERMSDGGSANKWPIEDAARSTPECDRRCVLRSVFVAGYVPSVSCGTCHARPAAVQPTDETGGRSEMSGPLFWPTGRRRGA